MKGHEFAVQVTRGEMPDIEQVRANCLNKTVQSVARRPVRKFILVAALIAVLAVSAVASVQIGKTYMVTDDDRVIWISPISSLPISDPLRRYLAGDDKQLAKIYTNKSVYQHFTDEVKIYSDGENDYCYQDGHYQKRFDTIDEAEAFFGIDILENSLTSEDVVGYFVPSAGITASINHWEGGYREDGEVYWRKVFGNKNDYGTVCISTSSAPGIIIGVLFGYSDSYQTIDQHLYTEQPAEARTYVSPINGITAHIAENHAVFDIGDIIYAVSVSHLPEYSDISIESVIDAFEK